MATDLWTDIDGEPWLDNPRRKRRRSGSPKRRRRSHAVAARTNPKRRRRHHRARHNPFLGAHRTHRRRGHRRFRRNPFSTRGVFAKAMDGVKGGLAVLLGEATVAAVPKLIPIAAIQTGIPNAFAEAAIALFSAPFVAKLIGPKWAQVYLYGGFARPLKGLVIGANVPILSGALASYPGSLLALPTPGASTLAATFDMATLEAEEASVM